MGPTSLLLCFSVLLTFSSVTGAYNITRLLGQYPNFGLLNQYITDSSLAGEINGRGTVTVLAVDNSSLSSISGRSKDSIKAIVSTHIILDYYDEKKLMNIRNDSTTLTTLYQSSGVANSNQGFLLVYNAGGGHFYFGSAVKGAPLNAQFVKTVVTQPYNISVLQVSQPIIPPGIDAQSPWPAPGAQTNFPPKQDDDSEPPAQSPSDDDSAADAPSDDTGGDDGASSPPASSTPVPAPADAPGPSDDLAADNSSDDSPSTPSSSARVRTGLVGTSMAFASLLIAL
ncbi:fasciclin-like arabinogalactan protein 3 [Prosopis cineraria]|uniref:fasciclin-like arabinogalactan protein 3 n=1 Tax=Prosopis cineraria TaxID=364024 RepID=UPI00240FC527|nr:fasciclin-like arabinogalactan protein 3 [Prosopis cineraria]